LLTMEDPPLVLYTLGAGALSAAQLEHSIAIVGSRNPTAQGAQNAKAFAKSFSACGLTVVSGLALGIDGAAHEGALDGAGPQHPLSTIAVVGTGLDRVYPSRHLALAHRISESGLLLSEYPLGTPPLAANFPKRNRLIAGLSRGTLVVEAAQPSGSLITARLAAEQGKEVFAIPGSIHAPQSRGCHALIKQGAKLVESAQDVLEELHFPSAAATAATADRTAPDPADADEVLAALGFDPAGLDALVARTGIDAATLQVRLLELELDGLVARLPGGLFQRTASA
jgi:DNA processing protein